MEVFLRIDGVAGPVTSPELRKGWFRATSYAWGGMAPCGTDVGSGRRHRPMRLVRAVDGASPVFAESLVNRAPVTAKGAVTVAADTVDVKGAPRPSATYVLRGAIVTALVLSAANGGADTVTEEVELTYTDITVQHDPSGGRFTDAFLGT